jgi:hypothetical protein
MDPDAPEGPRYSLEEARALLPTIRGTLLQLAIERGRHTEAHRSLHARLRTNGDPEHAEELRRGEELTADLRARIRGLLDHMQHLGVELRDADEGLVDIPTIRDGEHAWFCWRLADPELAFWHTTREGFAARRPL